MLAQLRLISYTRMFFFPLHSFCFSIIAFLFVVILLIRRYKDNINRGDVSGIERRLSGFVDRFLVFENIL